ncbi:MAG: hypothetical protein ACI823_002591 [Chitinophagales bacterium]|jgi:hypothetical protein
MEERYGQINDHWLVNEETVPIKSFKTFANRKTN